MPLSAGKGNSVRLRVRLRNGLSRLGVLEPGGAWSIAIFEGPDPMSLNLLQGLPGPVLSREDVTDVRADFVADPFMLQVEDRWHMFFEVMNGDLSRGQIGYAVSTDLQRWSYEGLALSLPYHLSYPLVFTHGGDIYMVPETSADGSVQLFCARSFPHDWELDSVLLRGRPFLDATLFGRNDRWFMFADTDPRARFSALRLYQASDLRGPWREHPSSPLYSGAEVGARPGGRVIMHEDRIIRYAQNCIPRYGTGVHAVEIETVTSTEYEENIRGMVAVAGAAKTGWNGLGMHHIDAHLKSPGHWVACVDGRSSRSFHRPRGSSTRSDRRSRALSFPSIRGRGSPGTGAV